MLIAYHLTHLLWARDLDPDIYALPLLSSFLDITGQLLLVGAFAFAGRGHVAESTLSETTTALLL